MTSHLLIHRTTKDVANSIRSSGKLNVFLGAGISRSAGIPLANEIISSLAKKLKGETYTSADENWNPSEWLEKQPFYNKDNPYASVLDAAFPNRTERAVYFESLVSGKLPSKAHLAIATLMECGIVPCVLTTNFDHLMEYSILHVCHQMPCVLLFDEVPTYVDVKSNRPKVLKLHGDYLFGNIRNLGYELYLVKESMRKKIELAARQGTLIVAGYSGADNSVMDVFEQLASEKKMFPSGVYWLALRGCVPNERVLKFLKIVDNMYSGVIEIDDSDTFFCELVKCLTLPSKHATPRLELNDHLITIENEARERFVLDRTDELSAHEFLGLLRRTPLLSDFAKSVAGLDYLLARFEESSEIPKNLGEFVDRYIDFLVGSGINKGNTNHYERADISKAEKRIQDLLDIGLIDNDEAQTEIKHAYLRNYIGALRLIEEELDDEEIGKMLSDEDAYGTLSYYVGFLEDATHVINSAIHQSVDSIVLHGRINPWPKTFYRAAALVGRASKVDQGTIERIADMLLLEFDTERWHPRGAMSALANMGEYIIDYLVQYMLDSLQDTFSREDATLALGQMGTRKVVDRLAKAAKGLTSRDTKMVVYALGLTGNPRAIPVLRDLAPNVAKVSNWVLQNALQALGYEGDDITATAANEERDPRPELVAEAILKKHIPDLEDRSCSVNYQKMFSDNPGACLKVVNKNICPPDATKLSRIGTRLLAINNPSEAEIIFAECLERYPMIDCSYHNIALAYSRQGRPLAARRYYATGLSLNPDYSDYYNDFAITMQKLNNLKAARHLLLAALSHDVDNYRPWLNLAMVNMSESKILKSPNISCVPDGDLSRPGLYTRHSEMNFGSVIHSGKLRDAYICLRQVLKLNPSHPTAKLSLESLEPLIGETCDQEPTPNELFQVLHVGETIIPDSVYIDDLPEEAHKAWKHSADLLYHGDLTGALSAMEEVLRIYPDTPNVYHNLSILYSTAGQTDKAAQCLDIALAKWPLDYHLLLNYSCYLTKLGHQKDALIVAEKAVSVEPQNAASWYQLAITLRANDKNDEAADACKEAMRFSTRWSTIEVRAKDLLEEIENPRVSAPPP